MANLNVAIKIAVKDIASGPIGKIANSITGLNGGMGLLQSAGKMAFGGIVAGASLAVGAMGVIGTAAFGVANDMQTATSEIQAALGTTTEEAERLGDIARDVWGNNFAGSISEAAGAVGLVRQQLGDMSDNELQDAAENAFRLADNFETDVPGAISAAKTLMEQFGLSSDEAFDFIATGFQRGLDRSGDFIDTIGEYSTQFANGGADAGQFFSLLESGLQGGMLGTDRAADAFKEFRVRIQDGSDGVMGALENIGLDANAMYEQMADGSLTAADAFEIVVGSLNEIDDENLRMQAGVALLGTQFEDLGTEAALGLSLVGTEMADMAGATDTLNAKYDTLGSTAEGYKRRALLALEPIGNTLLGLANNAMPLVDQAFSVFETTIVPAIETAALVVGNLFTRIADGEGALTVLRDILPPELVTMLDWVVTNGPILLDVLIGVGAAFATLTVIGTVAGWIGGLIAAWGTLSAAITAAGSVIGGIVAILGGPVTLAVAAVAAIVGLLAVAWSNNWFDIQGKTAAAVEFIQNIITSVMTAVQTFWQAHGDSIMESAAAAWAIIQENVETALSVIQSIFAAFKSAFEGDWRGFGENLREAWDTAWALVSERFTNAKNTILGIAAGLILDLIAKFGDTDWTQLGKDVIDGIVQGLANGAAAIVGKMQEIGGAAYDAWQGFWNSSSPSRLAMEGAGDVTDGFLVQWSRDKNALANAAAALGQSAYSGLFGSGGLQPGSSMASGGGVTNNYYFQADYKTQSERSLRDDIRMIQLMTG